MTWFGKDGNEHESDDDDEEQDNIIYHFDPPEYPDIAAFNNAQHKNLLIFLKARQEHGNHLDNPDWYERAGLAIKCWRYIKAYQKGELPTSEELSDLANYAVMIFSKEEVSDGDG